MVYRWLIWKYMGCALLLLGVLLRYWISRRRFYRRNAAGVEQFRRFSHKVTSQFFERIVAFISILMILSGILLLLAGRL